MNSNAEKKHCVVAVQFLRVLCVLCGLFLLGCSQQQNPPASLQSIQFDDASMQRAAAAALGEREGAMIMMNPLDGRVRAVVNPRLAFEQTFPPGSAIKPFTALVALRSGTLNQDLRVLCKTNFQQENFQISCSHKKINNSLNLTHALAYSCNYFFATVAERMNGGSFFAALDDFGFGARTKINAAEAAGKLQPSEWQISTALGNNDKILVTPIQMLTAYAALVNGGKLLRPRLAGEQNFAAQTVRNININPSQRKLLLAGMQGATAFGTAVDVGLMDLPYDVIGKTGTSGASNGFHTQGWFISFLLKYKNVKNVEPDDLQLAAIVLLKRAHGSEAASVAGEFYRRLLLGQGDRGTGGQEDKRTRGQEDKRTAGQGGTAKGLDNSHSALPTPQSFAIHLVRENKIVNVALEEYVRGVLAAEASVETEIAALQAQAIVSRTFALKNRGRHHADGYDFCSLTHCQRYVAELADHNKALILQATEQTAGQVLRDEHGAIADVYFHASCGGMTTNMTAVWGTASPPYLQAVRDDFCTTMPHKSWQQNIASAEILRALQSDDRSKIGARLDNIFIDKRDQSGRAEMMTLAGERRKQLRGWDFALIINRVLGWNTLKSARFDIARNGNNFIFRGSGFGHGLGFCQEGAHVMAQRGRKAEQILGHYFPGAAVNTEKAIAKIGAPPLFLMSSLLSSLPLALMNVGAPQFATASDEGIRLSYPRNVVAQDVAEILRTLAAARADLRQRFARAAINFSGGKTIQVILHNTTGDFMAATGQPAWAAGATRGNTIHLQPLGVLRKRGVVNTTLRHEFAHAWLEIAASRKTPRWLAEGAAIHFAGEGRLFGQASKSIALTELEQQLMQPLTASQMRVAYGAAYREIRQIIAKKGENFLWQKAINP